MSSLARLLARKVLAPAILVLAAIPATGCGGGGYGYGPGGTLEVRNDPGSFEGVEAVEVSTPFGPIDHFDVFLAPGERDFIDLIPDVYDVDLLWSDSSVDTIYAVDIYDGSTTVVTGSN